MIENKLLERIAIALERIADHFEQKKPARATNGETPFPWDRCSIRLRMAEVRARGDNDPTTAERLLRIGKHQMMRKAWRGVGEVTVLREIDPLMEALGFGEEWHNS